MTQGLRVEEMERYPAFGVVAQSIWPEVTPENLGVLMTPMKIGYFVLGGRPDVARVGEYTPPESVLMVSDYSLDESLIAPRSRSDIETAGLKWTYQNELLAKGGLLGANTPAAHVRKEFDRTRAAIRAVPIRRELGWDDLYVASGSDSIASLVKGFLQHGFGYAGALARDYAYQRHVEPSDRSLPGTDRAIRRRTDLYGDAICALLPISPSFYHYQWQKKVDHQDIAPGHVVVNMASSANPLSLRMIAECEIPQPRR